jgi:hypothetical protein
MSDQAWHPVQSRHGMRERDDGRKPLCFPVSLFLSMTQRALLIALPPRQYRSPALAHATADEPTDHVDQPDRAMAAGSMETSKSGAVRVAVRRVHRLGSGLQ